MDNQNGNKDNNKNNKQGFSFVILITMLTAIWYLPCISFREWTVTRKLLITSS